MTDILTRCIKCKCSLLAADKVSKLLPCLHTMCEDCMSGRTDVAEKIRRRKEEKEKKKEELNEEKTETNEGENEDSGEQSMDVGTTEVKVKTDGETEDCKPTAKTENTSDEQESAVPSDTKQSKDNETKEPNSKTPDDDQTEKPDPKVTDSENTKAEKSSDDAAQADDDDENKTEETAESKTDHADDDSKEGADTSEKMEEEGEDETPPEPVPMAECPICREPFAHDAVIENVFIRKKVVAADDEEGKEQICTGCETNPASSYCLQCDDWLCNDCVKAHKRVRMTKDHQLTSKEEAADVAQKAESGAPNEIDMLCRVHPKEKLTLFCEKCEVLTCRDCQLLTHQEHKYQFLQEAADSYKAKLTGSLSLMKERRDVLRKYQTEIEDRLNKVRKEKEELQQDILKQADTIMKAVRHAIWQVLSSLHSFTDAAAKRLSREVGDVGDLVGKFEHCITFMDGILDNGYGLPLLFSKSLVETKCRKVYHTHMEPQSLKGQLNIQYRHDVQTVLRSLPAIGAIYVNGSKYPPEKSATQTSPNTAGPTPSNTSAYRSNSTGAPNVVVGSATTGGLPHHLAPQDRSTYMQMLMTRQSHSSGSSQGPALTLPGSRRMANIAPQMANAGSSRAWPNPLVPGLPVSMATVLGQSQGQAAMLAQRGATFTPMRLHHRPMDGNHLVSSAPPMVLGAPAPQHRSQQGLGLPSHLPAPPPLRAGQPHYRGDGESDHHGSGAQSGIRRSAGDVPDPARPASGHTTPERPLSSEGAASSMRVKAEPHDSTDCVITSANFKGKKSPALSGSNSGMGDLQNWQKSLDEVMRGVPLDPGDNLEQINGDSLSLPTSSSSSSSSIRSTPQPPAAPVTPTPRTSMTPPAIATPEAPAKPSPAASPALNLASESRSRSKSGEGSEKSVNSPEPNTTMDSEGHQVKGMTTGNSMPGFSIEAAEAALADPNDDYCAVCHQGGDVLCCDQCPRVFHLNCHVPPLPAVPTGAFVCTLCEEGLRLEAREESPGGDQTSGKRKAPTGLSDKDLRVCERILLELFCHPSSIPFHEPVNRAVPNYYRIITNPMDFTKIKTKLSRNHFNHYTSVEEFLDDTKLVFRNCAVYNAETSEVGKAGKKVRETFHRLVDRHMTEYGSYARKQEIAEVVENERKKRKLTPPPHPNRHLSSGVVHGERVDDDVG